MRELQVTIPHPGQEKVTSFSIDFKKQAASTIYLMDSKAVRESTSIILTVFPFPLPDAAIVIGGPRNEHAIRFPRQYKLELL